MRFIPLLAVLLALVACEGGGHEGHEMFVSSPSLAPGGCPAPDSTPEAGKLSGRVDPDDAADEVYVHEDPGAPAGCARSLVLVTGSGQVVAAPIAAGDIEPVGGLPAIRTLTEIDERPGAEVVVEMFSGASTSFFAVFSAGGGVFEQMTIAEGPYGDLFPSGGSAGHMEAADCDSGGVTVALLEPAGARSRLTETSYSTEDGRFVLEDTTTERLPATQAQERFERFALSPFGSCPAE